MSWLTELVDHVRAGARVEAAEQAAVASGVLDGVDLLGRAVAELTERVPTIAEPVTPLEVLEARVGIARDYRDLELWDRTRKYDTRKHGWPADKSRGQSRGVREWASITTIVLHTAGVRGMHTDRWLGVPTHAAVADGGEVVLCHHLLAYLWAAHSANRYSMSLEVGGNRTLTDDQVEPARELVRYMVDERRRHHDGPLFIGPHRFFHKSRGVDCDAPIWGAVGEWAIRELDLELAPIDGSGRPLPFPSPRKRN